MVDADWHAFLGRAGGVKKPNESKKAKAILKMKAARDSGEDFYDPERKDNILGRNKTRLEMWEEHLKDPIVALDKAFEVRGESVSRLIVGSRLVVELVFNGMWLRGLMYGAKDVGQISVKRCLALFGTVGQRAFVHSIHAWERSRKVWTAR